MLEKSAEYRYTYGDYVQWTGDERWELIDGEPFLMSPAPSRVHQEIVVSLVVQISTFLQGKPCRVYVAPFDVRLPRGDEPDREIATVVQPDVAVICDHSKLDEAGCRGAPDWVIEVISPSTGIRDQVHKRDLYERHGVREYWTIDPAERLLTVYCRQNGDGFGSPQTHSARGQHPAGLFPQLSIDLDPAFERL